ncbi:MAG: multiheme c-type cytochrome [Dissulfurimicrobium sp.]|uniref:multiheme c-type cytochrome n=1 Tax=Dissulfurimicrobium sp. TaxID=2022436 RepID=UPI00404BA135
MKAIIVGAALTAALLMICNTSSVFAGEKISEATQTCLGCHESVTPGIVADWKSGRHSKMTVDEALNKPVIERRISIDKVPNGMQGFVVGCAECHTIDAASHKDTFEHNGFKVHVVVTPADCAKCHPVERDEYAKNIMSEAYGNLVNNPVYHSLMDSANGIATFDGKKATIGKPDQITQEDSCLYCHGTKIKVKGLKARNTSMGEMKFPELMGWPSVGVGRINPDGTKGSCTACHARHAFSVVMARKPATCSECHKGPDVPAYKVYSVSKHGNIYASMGSKWNFDAVPWKVGVDFSAPTCATCHVSLVVTKDGETVAKRTHQMNDRLPDRLFGLIYAAPQPKLPDTTIIRNKAGLPLPTELTGEPVAPFLIDAKEQAERKARMEAVCLSCHAQDWVNGHFARLDQSIKTTNEMTLTATKIVLTAWDKGLAKGLAQHDSIFNEAIEKMWTEEWLFFANSIRFASAMAGADYGVFADGRWAMARNIQKMSNWLEFLEATHKDIKGNKKIKSKEEHLR